MKSIKIQSFIPAVLGAPDLLRVNPYDSLYVFGGAQGPPNISCYWEKLRLLSIKNIGFVGKIILKTKNVEEDIYFIDSLCPI